MRILVVEDEKKVASFIERGLEAEHYTVDVAHDGDTGLARASNGHYDLVILDLMLPGATASPSCASCGRAATRCRCCCSPRAPR